MDQPQNRAATVSPVAARHQFRYDPRVRSLTTDMTAADARPYFLWDEDVSIAELKAVLAAGPSATRDRLMGKMLREARDVDVWHFTTPTEVALNMERLQRRIGRRYAFWAFLINGWRSDGLLHV